MLFCAREHRGFTLIDIMAPLVIIGAAAAAVMKFIAGSTSVTTLPLSNRRAPSSPPAPPLRSRGSTRWARGSVFIETMVAMTIVGVAIVALMDFMGGSTRAHGAVQEILQASDYAAAGLEYAANRPFNELAAMATAPTEFSPPVNGQGVAYTAAPTTTWKQVLSAAPVPEDNLRGSASSVTTALWLTVVVEHNGKTIHSERRLFMRDP